MLTILAAALSAAVAHPVAETARTDEHVCRDRIETVRAERGLPLLDREPARTDEPLLIAAVDKRINGCSVLVMRRDTTDVRPLPSPRQSQARLRPAR